MHISARDRYAGIKRQAAVLADTIEDYLDKGDETRAEELNDRLEDALALLAMVGAECADEFARAHMGRAA